MNLGGRLDEYKGIGPGFDHLRIGLAVSILLWHSFGAVYGTDWVATVPGFILAALALLLPMFFGLSGFLIMGSAQRTHNVRVFITFRVLRILPALFVEIVLSAVILGAIVTKLPLRDYFSNPQFWSYFGILIGAIKYWLPGVFVDNPLKVTNGALWTVGPEILCYCLVSGMMLTGLFIRKGPMVLCTIIFLGICILSDYWEADWNLVHLPIKALIFSFLSGNLIFLYRYGVPYNKILFWSFLTISIASIVVAQNFVQMRPCFYIAALLVPYCSAYIGLTDFGKIPFFHRGDYSYGIYIYGFPIQQALVFFFPAMRVWWFNFGLALPIATLFAVMSWHGIEKPVLGLRKKLLPKGVGAPDALVADKAVVKKAMILSVLVIYGLFVMNAARVFPLHEIISTLTGKSNTVKTVNMQQF